MICKYTHTEREKLQQFHLCVIIVQSDTIERNHNPLNISNPFQYFTLVGKISGHLKYKS